MQHRCSLADHVRLGKTPSSPILDAPKTHEKDSKCHPLAALVLPDTMATPIDFCFPLRELSDDLVKLTPFSVGSVDHASIIDELRPRD